MRVADWEQRLNALISENFTRPHEYGQFDCMLLCGDVAGAVRGNNPAAEHRGKYKSQATAVRYLKRLGFDTPEAMLDSRYVEHPIGFAQRGDLVLTPATEENGWQIPGVCMGDYALIIGTDGTREGLHRVPRSLWLKAWAL